MRNICPVCGQQTNEVIDDKEDILKYLRSNRERQIYKGRDNHWYLSHGGGEVSTRVLNSLISDGLVRQVYSNTQDVWHLGKTMDAEATLAFRKGRPRKEWKIIYTNESDTQHLTQPEAG